MRCLRPAGNATASHPVHDEEASSSSHRSKPSICSAWSCRSTVARGLLSRCPHIPCQRPGLLAMSSRISQTQRRHGIARASYGQPQCGATSPPMATAPRDQLRELFRKARRHLGRVGINDITSVVVIHPRACSVTTSARARKNPARCPSAAPAADRACSPAPPGRASPAGPPAPAPAPPPRLRWSRHRNVRHFDTRPPAVRSNTKSADHTSLGPCGRASG